MTATSGPVAGLRVTNRGRDLLELILEPYGSDHWLRPGETFVIWALTVEDVGLFEVDHEPGTVTVWAPSHAFVGDEDGEEIDCGHRRPSPPGLFRLPLP
ncbi:hypothetical protein ABZX99_28770 [Streptomyces antibioticus]|uniref:hypothetical protein n=1 Tax=Streptomyces antibioticus TaxID=1890 RepID=UPI0033BC1D47